METYTNPQAEYVYALLYNGINHTDVQGEFSLPDYLPDVRRILRVTADAHVTGRYMNGEKLELEGNVSMSLLYMSEENTIHCFSAPLPFAQNITAAGLDENTVITVKQTADNAVCRLSGPRKCTLRCRLKAAVRALTQRPVQPDLSALGSDETLCTHTVTTPACSIICAGSDDLRYAEDIPAGNAVISEVLTCSVTPVLSETRAGSGSVVCKGEYLLEAFCAFQGDGDGVAYRTLKKRVPFSETFLCEGVTDQFRCEPDISVISVIPTVTEDGRNLGMDFSVECSVSCMADTDVRIITDAFLPSYDVRITGEDVQTYLPVRMTAGNFSAAGNIRYDAAENIADVTDCVMHACIDRTEIQDSRLILTGLLNVSVIAQTEDMKYLPVSGEIPIRWETDGTGIPENSLSCISECHILSCSARPDNTQKTIACDAELQIFLSAARKMTVKLPKNVTLPTDAKKITLPPYPVILCYPQAGETLWDIAKRYRLTPEILCQTNRLPENTESVPETVRFLLIPISDLFREV
ncbi:MAG: SPOCS domain-containing protein [Eubacteriales bacterium]